MSDKCDICNRPIRVRTTDKLGIPIKNAIRLDIDTGHGQAIENWTVCPDCLTEVKSCIDEMLCRWNLTDTTIRLPKPDASFYGVAEQIRKGVAETNNNDSADEETTLKFYQNLVKSIWRGEWGNGLERITRLKQAGLDYVKVQRLVNLWNALPPGVDFVIEDLKYLGLL